MTCAEEIGQSRPRWKSRQPKWKDGGRSGGQSRHCTRIVSGRYLTMTSRPEQTVLFTYQPINMKIFQQERRNALPPLALSTQIALSGSVGLSFFFPSHAKLAAHFPHSRAASHCSTVIIAAAAERSSSRSDIFGQTAGGSSFAVWIGVELSLCLLSRSCRPPACHRQPDSPPPSFPCPLLQVRGYRVKGHQIKLLGKNLQQLLENQCIIV